MARLRDVAALPSLPLRLGLVVNVLLLFYFWVIFGMAFTGTLKLWKFARTVFVVPSHTPTELRHMTGPCVYEPRN